MATVISFPGNKPKEVLSAHQIEARRLHDAYVSRINPGPKAAEVNELLELFGTLSPHGRRTLLNTAGAYCWDEMHGKKAGM